MYRQRAQALLERPPVHMAVTLTAALAAIVGGYLVGFALTRPPAPATPAPSFVGAGATQSPEPTPTPTPTPTPSPTPTARPTATAQPTSAPPPPPLPTAAPRPVPMSGPTAISVRFVAVGLDDPAATDDLKRVIRFSTNRAGSINVALTQTSGGDVEVCLSRVVAGGQPAPPSCDAFEEGTLTQATAPELQEWALTVAAVDDGETPVTTVTVSFPSTKAAVAIGDFVFQGTDSPEYNGFRAQLGTRANGRLQVDASWKSAEGDGDATQDYRLSVSDLSDPRAPPYRSAGTNDRVVRAAPVARRHRYEIGLSNAAPSVGRQLKLDASLSWP